MLYYVFFFSSRRRHTSSDRDWSSDVCSSDLSQLCSLSARPNGAMAKALGVPFGRADREQSWLVVGSGPGEWLVLAPPGAAAAVKIGRASWRERVEGAEGAGALKTTNQSKIIA